ncbi:MAG TPA: ABC transporter ATP-binding protein [Candidatus Limnocylindria bacterium]|nr:ABC transporter ATP-binding protein [Candidatus Limnocylindria bacterium]
MGDLLQLHGVTASYGQVAVLHDVDLSVQEGECAVLLGANGMGKSTLLRTISGVVPPRAGRIEYAGRSLIGASPHEIAARGIAHVPEGRGIFPGLTVYENLRLGGYVRRHDAKTERTLVDRVCRLFPQLREKLPRPAASLSGGQQQMLAIARGLMSEPHLLLLDEPSLGLAPVLVDQVFAALRQIKEQGTTLLLVEQSARHALALADRGYVLNRGQIVQRGTAEQLRATLHQAYLG